MRLISHSLSCLTISLLVVLPSVSSAFAFQDPTGKPVTGQESSQRETPAKDRQAADGQPQQESTTSANKEDWIQLFNGVDLEGWTPKIRGYELGENFSDTFRVEDGLLKVNYEGYDKFSDRFGHLFYKERFSHYILRVEYRFTGEQVRGGAGWAWRNSGVMLHGQDPETMLLDQNFPVSIEAQFLGGDGKQERPTLNLCTPGTHVELDGKLFKPHCTSSTSPTFHGDEWVTVVLEVHGNDLIRHMINDKVVLEYSRPQLDPDDADAKPLIVDGNLQLDCGTISLQSESHPIEFRKVEIRILEPSSANPKNPESKPATEQDDGQKDSGDGKKNEDAEKEPEKSGGDGLSA